VSPLTGDREFESISLQRGVYREPARAQPPRDLRLDLFESADDLIDAVDPLRLSQERAIGKDSSSNRSIRGSGQPEWDRQSERSGCLQVDDQLELGWLLDRQIRGVFIGAGEMGVLVWASAPASN
jgi:hypothetical protein